jgi:hypothetical protein
MRLPSLSQIYLPPRARPWRAAMSCVRCCRLPRCALHPTPCGSPIQRRALPALRPHPAPRSILCHARSSSLHAEMLLVCYWHRRSPLEGLGCCRRRGRRDTRPRQGDVAMKAHVTSVCFKCFKHFLRYVAIVLYRCCRSRLGMLYMLCMLQVFQRFIQNVSSVPDERCKFWSRCCICFHTYSLCPALVVVLAGCQVQRMNELLGHVPGHCLW